MNVEPRYPRTPESGLDRTDAVVRLRHFGLHEPPRAVRRSVLRSHMRSALNNVLLGSVKAPVLVECAMPVLVAH